MDASAQAFLTGYTAAVLKYFWLPLLGFAIVTALLFILDASTWVFWWYFRICCVGVAFFGFWVMRGRVNTKDKDRDVYR